MLKDAILSDDRRYRYVLSRTWDETKEANFNSTYEHSFDKGKIGHFRSSF